METPKRPVKAELLSGERWRSSFFYLIRIVVILCIPLAVWSYFQSKSNVNRIQVGKGGMVKIDQRTRRFFIPFVEAGGEKTNSNKFGTYVRFGVRAEF
jgi:hypothetical protein